MENMKDLEIWKVKGLDFDNTVLLVSSHGNIKNRFGYKKVNVNDLVDNYFGFVN